MPLKSLKLTVQWWTQSGSGTSRWLALHVLTWRRYEWYFDSVGMMTSGVRRSHLVWRLMTPGSLVSPSVWRGEETPQNTKFVSTNRWIQPGQLAESRFQDCSRHSPTPKISPPSLQPELTFQSVRLRRSKLLSQSVYNYKLLHFLTNKQYTVQDGVQQEVR